MLAPIFSLLTLAASVMAGVQKTGPPKPDLTYLFTVNITSAPSISFGTTPFGPREFVPITGGTFSGPKVAGETDTRDLPPETTWL